MPLTDLTKKGQPNKVHWSDCHERAFKTLKGALCSFPILKLPDISQKFFLQTDASGTGIGSVLLQEEDGVKKPVAFVSRKLIPSTIPNCDNLIYLSTTTTTTTTVI